MEADADVVVVVVVVVSATWCGRAAAAAAVVGGAKAAAAAAANGNAAIKWCCKCIAGGAPPNMPSALRLGHHGDAVAGAGAAPVGRLWCCSGQ